MAVQTRRQRERKERERLIVTAARELAEAEGWDAATTRRPAAKDTRGRSPRWGPAPLKEAFGEPAQAVAPIAAEGEDLGVLTETY